MEKKILAIIACIMLITIPALSEAGFIKSKNDVLESQSYSQNIHGHDCDWDYWSNPPHMFTNLSGNVGIGSIRYTTSGGTSEESLKRGMQPVFAEAEKVKLAVAFNGNIVNISQLKGRIKERFPDFFYECDAELICRELLLELMENNDLTSSVTACMKEVEGAFSVTGITQDEELFVFKDPCGIRPLCCGHSENRKLYASSAIGSKSMPKCYATRR